MMDLYLNLLFVFLPVLLIAVHLLTLFYPFYPFIRSANQVQKRFTMNIQQPISIDSVDSTQDQNDGYDLISDDSIQNDSKDDLDHNKERIIYSRVS